MNGLVYRLIPMILSFGLSQLIYAKIDKKYDVTNKVMLYLHVKHRWKGLVCYCCTLIGILIIGALDIYVIVIPEILYAILSGILIGIGLSMAFKVSKSKTI